MHTHMHITTLITWRTIVKGILGNIHCCYRKERYSHREWERTTSLYRIRQFEAFSRIVVEITKHTLDGTSSTLEGGGGD